MGTSISSSPKHSTDQILRTEEEESWFRERYIVVNRINDECLGNCVLMDEKKNGMRRICVKEISVSFESELKSVQTLLLKNFKRGSTLKEEDNHLQASLPESIGEGVYYHKNLIGIYEAIRVKPKEESFGCDMSTSSSKQCRLLYGLEYYPNRLSQLQNELEEQEVWNLLEQVSSALSFISKTRNANHGNLHSASIFIDDSKTSKNFKIVDPFIAEDIDLVETILCRKGLGEKFTGCYLAPELLLPGSSTHLTLEDLIKADIFSLGCICLSSIGKQNQGFEIDQAFEYKSEERNLGDNLEIGDASKKKKQGLSLQGNRCIELRNPRILRGNVNFKAIENCIRSLFQSGKYSKHLLDLLRRMVDQNGKNRPELISLFDQFSEHSTIHTEHSFAETPRNSQRQLGKQTNMTRCAQFHSPNSSPMNNSLIATYLPSTEIKKESHHKQQFSANQFTQGEKEIQRPIEQAMFSYSMNEGVWSVEENQARIQAEAFLKSNSSSIQSINNVSGSFSRGRSPFALSDQKETCVRKFSGHKYKQMKILESSPQNLQVISRQSPNPKERKMGINPVTDSQYVKATPLLHQIDENEIKNLNLLSKYSQLRDPLIHLSVSKERYNKLNVPENQENLKPNQTNLFIQTFEKGNQKQVSVNENNQIGVYNSSQDNYSEQPGWKIKLSGQYQSEGRAQDDKKSKQLYQQETVFSNDITNLLQNHMQKKNTDTFRIGVASSRQLSTERYQKNPIPNQIDTQQFGQLVSEESNRKLEQSQPIRQQQTIPCQITPQKERGHPYQTYNSKYDANSKIYKNSIRINPHSHSIGNQSLQVPVMASSDVDNSGQLTEQILESSLIQLDAKSFSSCSPCNVSSSRSNQIHLQLNTLASSSQASRQPNRTPSSFTNLNDINIPPNFTFENQKYKQIVLDTVKETEHQSEISEKTISPPKYSRTSKEMSSNYDRSQDFSDKKSTLSSFSLPKEKQNGYGTLFYPDGRMAYEGGLFDGLYHGTGSLWNEFQLSEFKQPVDFRNLDSISAASSWLRFEGEFENGLKKGFGSIFFVNGDLFQGNFSENQASGIGTFTPSLKTVPSSNKYATVIVGNWTKNILTQVLQEQTVLKLK